MSLGAIIDKKKKEYAWDWTKCEFNYRELLEKNKNYEWVHESWFYDENELVKPSLKEYKHSKRLAKELEKITG